MSIMTVRLDENDYLLKVHLSIIGWVDTHNPKTLLMDREVFKAPKTVGLGPLSIKLYPNLFNIFLSDINIIIV